MRYSRRCITTAKIQAKNKLFLAKKQSTCHVKTVEMDENVTLPAQLGEKDGYPVALINKFNISPEDADIHSKLGG